MIATRSWTRPALALLATMAVTTPAHAQWRGADADTALAPRDTLAAHAPRDSAAVAPFDRYLGGLADSTARRFGAVAAPVDTSGFAHLLATADWDSLSRPRHRLRPEFSPWWRFDRTTGHVLGMNAALGTARRGTRLTGALGYAFASKEGFGRGELSRRWGERGTTRWDARLGVGRVIDTLDPDRGPSLLNALWGALEGADGESYLRRDGAEGALARESGTLRLTLRARSELESPRATVTEWNLLGHALERVDNVPARLQRVRELRASATWRLPWPAWWSEVEVRQAARVAGGDVTYTRTRAALAAKLGLARWATLVPQAMYGRLEGDLAPQESFWLGGSSSLRSIPAGERSAQRKAFGRLELFGAPDLLALARIPHPPVLDLYAAAQVASGAVWGDDPYGGPSRGGHAWPDRADWLSEAGVSLMYRPGIPSPDGFVRFDWAHGIGTDPHRARWSMQFSLPFDQLVPLGR